MTIVYSYDFSEAATESAPAAAALAALFQQPLLLAHVVDPTLRRLAPELETKLDVAIQRRLENVADGLRAPHPGLQVNAIQLQGEPADTLNALAAREGAELLVVASPGHAEVSGGVSSVSERIAHWASVPVLVIRDPRPWLDWGARQRPLRAVLGVSRDSSCERAIELTTRVRTTGPCDVVATEIYLLQDMETNYGLTPPPQWPEQDPQLERLMERDLSKRISGLRGSGEIRTHLHRAAGPTADHLLDLAERERADVVVLGRHSPLRRRQESVSDVVLHRGRISMLIAPESARAVASDPPPRVRRVLAATDLSRFGNQSVRHALGLIQATQGELHLLHVADAQAPSWDEQTSITATLRKLLPEDCPFRVSTEVVFGREPAAAIAAAAERIDADAICVASHARGGLTRVALGSVTDALLRKTHRPVLVVRPDGE
jgi:nucleotide-binding universal stress UspA family protein